MRIVLLIFLAVFSGHAVAQVKIPFRFTSEEENRLIKENDSLKYYEATGDSEKIVCIDEEASYYRLLNNNYKVIDEGGFVTEGEKLVQDGKWTEHYENGKTKLTGYFHRSRPIGTWKEYYQEGKIKTVYNFAIIINSYGTISCQSGSYQEFYPDGKLKVNGFYAAIEIKMNDTSVVEDPITAMMKEAIEVHSGYKSRKTGHWEYYSEEGEVEKKEDF